MAISIRRSLDKYMFAENSLSNSKSCVLENAVLTLLLLTKSLIWSVFDELLAGDAGGLSFLETATQNFYLNMGCLRTRDKKLLKNIYDILAAFIFYIL